MTIKEKKNNPIYEIKLLLIYRFQVKLENTFVLTWTLVIV